MANESDLPQFHAGPETPIGKIMGPKGLAVAQKKQASGLMKQLMAHAKPKTSLKAKGKTGRKLGRSGRRGIEADSKVRFGTYHKFY